MVRLVLGVFLLAAVLQLTCAPPPAPTVCSGSAECGSNEYCAKTEGDCDGEGTCEARAGTCTADYDPVCGCDGVTYPNACEASRAGVSVAAKGQCVALPPPPAVCTDNASCGQGAYCSRPDGSCAVEGTCTTVPSVCAQVYDPVCGCDGVTYPNACLAAMAGTSVAAAGECAPPPAGSCTSNSECAPADYCKKAEGDCAGTGVCSARPEICAAYVDPVIGCNGLPYPNACEAARAGVNVR